MRTPHGSTPRGAQRAIALAAVVLLGAACATAPGTDEALPHSPIPAPFELLEVRLEPREAPASPEEVVEHRPPELRDPLSFDDPPGLTDAERAALRDLDRVRVTVQVYVDATGRVREASIREATASAPSLHRALLEAVESVRFEPGRANGVPTSMWTFLSLEYRLR